jgi:hypothetical protein
MIFLIIGSVVILAVLAAYAYHLHVKLGRYKTQQAGRRTELETFLDERRTNMTNSVSIVANTMLEGQMSTVECCLRLSNLLNKLGDVADQQRFVVFHTVAAEVEHIPILDEWQALKFKQRMIYKKEMESVESMYRDFVLDSCRSLLQQGIDDESSSEVASVGVYHP